MTCLNNQPCKGTRMECAFGYLTVAAYAPYSRDERTFSGMDDAWGAQSKRPPMLLAEREDVIQQPSPYLPAPPVVVIRKRTRSLSTSLSE